MCDAPRNLTLERVNRLQQSVADLMEAQTTRGRQFIRMLSLIHDGLTNVRNELALVREEQARDTKALGELQSEVVPLANRVEEAFSRALRTNIRLDDMEERPPTE